MKESILIVGLFVSAAFPVSAAPVFRQTLEESQRAALAHSPRVQSAQTDADAARSAAKSQFATLWPKISFDASYRYQSEIPSFAPAPGIPPTEFGDHKNYSYGPALNWLAWDSGGVYNRWKSAQSTWKAKSKDLELAQRQLLLEARLDYFQVQLGLEQVRSLVESLRLAQAQYKDISLRRRAGASSRLDALSAHQEVLSRQRLLRQAQADLANALETLFTLTGSTPPASATVPVDESVASNLPPETAAPTLLVQLDPLTDSQKKLDPAAQQKFDVDHPQLASLSEQIAASQASVDSVKAGHYPFLQVTAKTSRDYPNGPVRERINQNTVGLVASLPLFEFGRVTDSVAQQKNLMLSIEHRREQTEQDLERDWRNAHDQWEGLAAQQPIYRDSVQEAATISQLTYEAYKAGQVSFLEVQNANLRELNNQVASARNDVQLLIQLAILDSLSAKE